MLVVYPLPEYAMMIVQWPNTDHVCCLPHLQKNDKVTDYHSKTVIFRLGLTIFIGCSAFRYHPTIQSIPHYFTDKYFYKDTASHQVVHSHFKNQNQDGFNEVVRIAVGGSSQSFKLLA